MYLVHVHLWPHPCGDELPASTATALADCGSDVEGFEHVSLHRENESGPVVGVYLRASSLEAAESTAESLWWRACTAHSWLYGWKFRRAEVPLMTPELFPWNWE